MRRIYSHKRIKSGMTLVELVVAMALTAIFGAAFIVLVLPVERIYTRTTDVSRAQLLADTIVDSLRAECANAYVQGVDDIWIGNDGNALYSDTNQPTKETDPGSVLVIRKNSGYCETIFANGSVPLSVYTDLTTGESAIPDSGDISSRAILKLFYVDSSDGQTKGVPGTEAGYVHFGYFKSQGGNSSIVYPVEAYDYTNPFAYAAYREYKVKLTFSDLSPADKCHTYVNCQIDIFKENAEGGAEIVYTRNTVLCFAGQVQE